MSFEFSRYTELHLNSLRSELVLKGWADNIHTLKRFNSRTNTATFNKNYNYFINTHSSANTPNIIELYNAKGEKQRTIKKSF